MKDKRYKTQWELHREDTNPLNKLRHFKDVFPQIDKLYIEVLENGEKPSWPDGPDIYSEEHVREYLDCHNPRCKMGGFRIGDLLHRMVKEKRTFLEVVRKCMGKTSPPRGWRTYPKSCRNVFNIKIQIEFKAGHEDSETGT